MPSKAQESPTQVRYSVMNLHALRYYQFETEADELLGKLWDQELPEPAFEDQKTSVDFMLNQAVLQNSSFFSSSVDDWLYRYILGLYGKWTEYMRPLSEKPEILDLNLFLSLDSKEGNRRNTISSEGFFEILGRDNMLRLWNDILGDADLFRRKSDVIL
ncbi:MAG: hypothetical protein LBN18_04170, partial [Dysgonamonadaceae bacterium]|nr:hypothetical protein [Dysgonamonadaceae bacterium]